MSSQRIQFKGIGKPASAGLPSGANTPQKPVEVVAGLFRTPSRTPSRDYGLYGPGEMSRRAQEVQLAALKEHRDAAERDAVEAKQAYRNAVQEAVDAESAAKAVQPDLSQMPELHPDAPVEGCSIWDLSGFTEDILKNGARERADQLRFYWDAAEEYYQQLCEKVDELEHKLDQYWTCSVALADEPAPLTTGCLRTCPFALTRTNAVSAGSDEGGAGGATGVFYPPLPLSALPSALPSAQERMKQAKLRFGTAITAAVQIQHEGARNTAILSARADFAREIAELAENAPVDGTRV